MVRKAGHRLVRSELRRTLLLVTPGLAFGLPIGDAASAADTPAPQTAQLEEITVTARKHEESLQTVPQSVTAITADEVAGKSMNGLSDIGQSVPNFDFGLSGPTGRGAGAIYIRGVGQLDTTTNFDPGVGVYIDGVYLGRTEANDLDMLDIDRVEILRGPQGTLFGRNSEGGAVNVITKQPDPNAFSGWLQATFGSFDRADVMGGLNIPVVADKMAVKVTAERLYNEGYGTRTDGERTGGNDSWAARVQILVKPTDEFSAEITLDGKTFDETGPVEKLVDVNTGLSIVQALNAFTPQKYDDRWLTGDDFESNATGPNLNRGSAWGAALTLNYDAGWADLKSITAIRGLSMIDGQDPDNSPATILDYYISTRQNQISQELQATGKGFDNRLDWVVGGYYFYESASQPIQAVLLPALVPGCGACFVQESAISTESYAVYGQGNYNITDALRLTAGLRVTYDNKTADWGQFTYPGGVAEYTVPRQQDDWTDASPRVGFDYQWTPDIMTYVSVSRGYKSGGYNTTTAPGLANPRFNPESVWNYEIGLRSDLFDRHVRLNATAFYADYSDQQMQIQGATVGPNNTLVPFNVTDNVPKSRIIGGEGELTIVPTAGLTLTSGLGLAFTKYTQLPTDAFWRASNLVTTNDQFPYTPEVSFTQSIEYSAPVTETLIATGRVDYAYKSEIYYDLPNTPQIRQPAYSLVNLRLTLEHEPSQVSVSAFATNLTDTHYFTAGLPYYNSLGFNAVDMAPPREFGVSLRWRF